MGSDEPVFHGPQFGPDKSDIWTVIDAAEMLNTADPETRLSDEEKAAIERLKAWLGPRPETPEMQVAKAAIERIPVGFAMLGPNRQGCRVWQHEATRIVFIECPGEKPFLIAKNLVTQAVWERVMGSNPSYFSGSPVLPVESVPWDDCQEFCKRTGLRLPTESEWEMACRAGSTTDFCFGNDKEMLGDYAWFSENSGGKTHPVGLKKPNAWGIYDMHGNVWEHCDGSYSNSLQVVRGGCWLSGAVYCRSAFRLFYSPSDRSLFGFRPARSL